MQNSLASLYSTIDSAKRKVGNFLSDPAEVAQQYFQNANTDAGKDLNLLGQAFMDSQGRPSFGNMSPESRAAADAMSNKMLGGIAGTIAPGLGKLTPIGQIDKYAKDLSAYTPRVYRQTGLEELDAFIPGSSMQSQQGRMFFANHPDYALGQGGNRGGAVLEFDAAGIPGMAAMSKPGARDMYDKGYAEFQTHPLYPSEVSQNLRSVKLAEDQLRTPYGRRVESSLGRAGFTKTKAEDGSVMFVLEPK